MRIAFESTSTDHPNQAVCAAKSLTTEDAQKPKLALAPVRF
jgi:hypothetical protein